MANNVTGKDAGNNDKIFKTTDNGTVHTPHVNVDSVPLASGAATESTVAGIKIGTDKIPASPAAEHVTAGSPHAVRLTDGTSFYKTTTPSDTQPVSAASLPLPSGAASETTQSAGNTLIGAVNETAPASDTASSGLNGRLQRIAQRITSLIALLPTALGGNGGLKVEVVGGSVAGTQYTEGDTDASITGTAVMWEDASNTLVAASDGKPVPVQQGKLVAGQDIVTVENFDARIGSLTETAPASDTASSGLNGRLQRIAQRITSLIALFPSALSNGFFQVSLKETITQPASQSGTWTVQPGNTANTTAWKVDGSAVTQPVSGTVTANAGTGTHVVGGVAAHDAAVSGNPVLIGGEARASLGTATTEGDATRIATNRYGMVQTTALPPSHYSTNGTPLTATTTGVISAPSAGSHLRIVRIHVSNGGATACWVAVRDGASGTRHYNTYLPQGGAISINLNSSGPLDLTTATRADLYMSAAGSIEAEIDYLTVAD